MMSLQQMTAPNAYLTLAIVAVSAIILTLKWRDLQKTERVAFSVMFVSLVVSVAYFLFACDLP
jgi:hypothetical protein